MSGEVYQFIGKKFTKKLIKIIKTFPMISEKFSDDWIFVGLKNFYSNKIFVLSILFIEFFILSNNLNRPTKFTRKT